MKQKANWLPFFKTMLTWEEGSRFHQAYIMPQVREKVPYLCSLSAKEAAKRTNSTLGNLVHEGILTTIDTDYYILTGAEKLKEKVRAMEKAKEKKKKVSTEKIQVAILNHLKQYDEFRRADFGGIMDELGESVDRIHQTLSLLKKQGRIEPVVLKEKPIRGTYKLATFRPFGYPDKTPLLTGPEVRIDKEGNKFVWVAKKDWDSMRVELANVKGERDKAREEVGRLENEFKALGEYCEELKRDITVLQQKNKDLITKENGTVCSDQKMKILRRAREAVMEKFDQLMLNV